MCVKKDPVTQGFGYNPLWLHTEQFLICIMWPLECGMCYLLGWGGTYDYTGMEDRLGHWRAGLTFFPWGSLSLNLALGWKPPSPSNHISDLLQHWDCSCVYLPPGFPVWARVLYSGLNEDEDMTSPRHGWGEGFSCRHEGENNQELLGQSSLNMASRVD